MNSLHDKLFGLLFPASFIRAHGACIYNGPHGIWHLTFYASSLLYVKVGRRVTSVQNVKLSYYWGFLMLLVPYAHINISLSVFREKNH